MIWRTRVKTCSRFSEKGSAVPCGRNDRPWRAAVEDRCNRDVRRAGEPLMALRQYWYRLTQWTLRRVQSDSQFLREASDEQLCVRRSLGVRLPE